MKKHIITVFLVVFAVLLAAYVVDFNRFATADKMQARGGSTATDYMLSSLNVTSVAEDDRGLVWIGTSAGINVFDGQTYTQFFHDTRDTTALPDDYINCLHRDHRGRMWVGTQNGLALYEGAGRFRRYALPEDDCNILCVADDATDTTAVVASTAKRCFRVSTDGVKPMAQTSKPAAHTIDTVPDAPYSLRKPHQLVTCVYNSPQGFSVVGFRNAGYQIVSPNQTAFKRANDNRLAEATRGKDVTSMARVGRHLLAGTTLRLYVYDAQSHRLDEDFYTTLFDSVAGVKPELNNIVALDDSRAWLIGNREVLACRIDNGEASVVGRAMGVADGSMPLGMGARLGDRLYVSCDANYILRLGFGEKTERIVVNSPFYDSETQLTALRNGSLLVFMKNMHLAVYTPATRTLAPLPIKGAPMGVNIDPAFVREDSYGNVWLGTKRFGLYRLDMKTLAVSRADFLNDVHVQGLVEDDRRQLWITTLKDAVCYNPKTGTVLMNSLVSSSQNEWLRQFFDNSLCLAADGCVVYGSSDGCYFLPTTSQPLTEPLSTDALRIYALNVKTTDGRQYVLNDDFHNADCYTFAHDENTLKLSFFYPNFGGSSALMYQYRLEGYDTDWREPSYEHDAQYANLPSGKYVFRVRLISSPHIPPVAERSLTIVVRPAWWRSAAAWLLYAACVFCLLWYVNTLYLRLRTNRMLLLNAQHEREREQRTNEMNMNFFANISHEFRNPITIIAGPLLSLRSDTSLSEKAQRTLDRVCLSVNRMLRLIDQMLDFNQLETDALRLKVSRADAADALRQLAATFEDSARVRGISMTLRIDEADYMMWLDTDKFEKIMSNLFTNALKHTPDGGHIALRASVEAAMLRVEVFNSGSHIPSERLQDVFKRYYQLVDTEGTHHYGWGTGIGLYYVHRLVGLHHGTINVANVTNEEHEEGVQFCFTLPTDNNVYKEVEHVTEHTGVMQLPMAQKPNGVSVVMEEAPIATAAEKPSKARPRILIVDDDIDVAQYIRSLFVDDYDVLNRYSAEDALADIEQTAPDIVLSDIIMGAMSGYELCRRLKADLATSHIPVVLITAKSNIDEQVSGLRLGAVAYVTKPFDPAYLRALVEAQLNNVRTLRQRLGESTRTEEVADVATTMSEQDRRFMDELYALMERRSAELELNVATVCHDLLISQSKFNYKLKQLTGDTPGVFFRKYKLNRAAQLLNEGKYNVSEVATMTGFGTAAHFSVAFKKQFGETPSEYSERH